MKIKLFLLNFTLALVYSQQDSEENAKIFIKKLSDEFCTLYKNLSTIAYENDNDNYFQTLMKLNIIQDAAKTLTNISKQVQHFDNDSYENITLKLGIENIRMASYLYVLDDDYFNTLLISTISSKKMATDRDICEYNFEDNCALAYSPHIQFVFGITKNEQELKYYWNAWRKQNEEFGGTYLANFIELFRKAARETYVTPLTLWYRFYGESDFLNEMSKVMTQILPFYKEYHAYIRYILNKKYGNDVVPINGPIPYHLYEQVLVQVWKEYGNVLDIPYPDAKLPVLDEKLNEKEYSARKLVEIADEFYKSLGFSELPSEFWANRVKEFTQEQATFTCKAEIFDKTSELYLKYCPQISFKRFLQTHGWIGRLHYANQKRNLPFSNFQSYNFEIPVGEAIILSASTPKHLRTIEILSKTDEYTEEQRINRLFKMGLHTMLNIPVYFIYSKIINDLLSGQIEIEKINSYYWKLMEEYAGVMPPIDRNEKSFDFPHKFYEDLENNHQTTKFVSEIVGYQIYRSLCEKSGQYSSNNAEEYLYNCDFYGNKEAGKTLIEMMKLGSTQPWRKVLSKVTNSENGLNGDALLQYYEPVKIWLENVNKNNTVTTGWEKSNRKLE